jgi:mono/diheme cytochrome c family protein
VRIEIFLDEEAVPRATFEAPATFELDTTTLPDGRHRLRVRAIDGDGSVGIESMAFTVRNGPGIDVVGLSEGETVRGRLPILLNAFSSRLGDTFEAIRAETPAPIPTWAWVLTLVVAAWAIWYAAMEFHDYRQTRVAAVRPAVEGSAHGKAQPNGQASWAALGEQVYGNKCAACHQLSGAGVSGVFPPLAGDPVVTATDPADHVRTVLNGLQGKTIGGVTYPAPMPPFAGQLTDEEIAAVVNHERTSWGHQAPLVATSQVTALR